MQDPSQERSLNWQLSSTGTGYSPSKLLLLLYVFGSAPWVVRKKNESWERKQSRWSVWLCVSSVCSLVLHVSGKTLTSSSLLSSSIFLKWP